MINWSDYPNFEEHEFTCKCGCGQTKMKPAFMMKLQNLRTSLGFPLTISSGYRCPDYNDSVSTTGRDGPHTTGEAVDILTSGAHAHALVGKAFLLGFQGVGVSQKGDHARRFVHLDTLGPPAPRPWVWSY